MYSMQYCNQRLGGSLSITLKKTTSAIQCNLGMWSTPNSIN